MDFPKLQHFTPGHWTQGSGEGQHKQGPVQCRGWCCPAGCVAPACSLHSPGPEKAQVAFPAAPLMEDSVTFSGEELVWMVVPTTLLVWELGSREAPSLAPSPHSRQSPAVGQRKFGEGRKEEKIPDRFHLSKPRMIPLEACKPFSSQTHLFIFLTAGCCSQ